MLWSLLHGLPIQLAFGVTKWNVCRVLTSGTFTSWTSALKMCHSATSSCYRCLIIVKQRFKWSTSMGYRQTEALPSNPSYHNYHIRTAGSYGGRQSHSHPSQRPTGDDLCEGHTLLCGPHLNLCPQTLHLHLGKGWGLSWLCSFPPRTLYVLLHQAKPEPLGYSFFGNSAFLVT